MFGVGRPSHAPKELEALAEHRARHLRALLQRARKDDEKREIERELRELDEAIALGVEQLEAHKREALWKRLEAAPGVEG